MAISKVTVNHIDKNWFNDYDELYNDEMILVTDEKVAKAVERLVRRFKGWQKTDVLFVTNEDGTGWRLMYDQDQDGRLALTLRHYTNMEYGSWDTNEKVSAAKAKKLILGDGSGNE